MEKRIELLKRVEAGLRGAGREGGRGFALVTCQALLQRYFEAGYDLCWLSAAEGAQRLYEKLGFEAVGSQLNYGIQKG